MVTQEAHETTAEVRAAPPTRGSWLHSGCSKKPASQQGQLRNRPRPPQSLFLVAYEGCFLPIAYDASRLWVIAGCCGERVIAPPLPVKQCWRETCIKKTVAALFCKKIQAFVQSCSRATLRGSPGRRSLSHGREESAIATTMCAALVRNLHPSECRRISRCSCCHEKAERPAAAAGN
jgi:hypothetical protein